MWRGWPNASSTVMCLACRNRAVDLGLDMGAPDFAARNTAVNSRAVSRRAQGGDLQPKARSAVHRLRSTTVGWVLGAAGADGRQPHCSAMLAARWELRCIGANNLDEHRQHIEKGSGLERPAFQQVFVESSPRWERHESRSLRGLKERYEGPPRRTHRRLTRWWQRPRALTAANIADRFLPDKRSPDWMNQPPD